MNVQDITAFGARVMRRLPHRRPVTAREVAAAIADHLAAGGHLDAGLTRGVADLLGVRRRRAARLLARLRAGEFDGQRPIRLRRDQAGDAGFDVPREYAWLAERLRRLLWSVRFDPTVRACQLARLEQLAVAR